MRVHTRQADATLEGGGCLELLLCFGWRDAVCSKRTGTPLFRCIHVKERSSVLKPMSQNKIWPTGAAAVPSHCIGDSRGCYLWSQLAFATQTSSKTGDIRQRMVNVGLTLVLEATSRFSGARQSHAGLGCRILSKLFGLIFTPGLGLEAMLSRTDRLYPDRPVQDSRTG